MSTTLEEMIARMPPESRKRIHDRADRLHEEYLARMRKQMRKEKNLTQQKLADILGVQQASIAATENQQDFLISTLRNYVSAMGGIVDLVVRFPNEEPIVISEASGDDEQADGMRISK